MNIAIGMGSASGQSIEYYRRAGSVSHVAMGAGPPRAPGEDVTKRAVEYLKGIVNSKQ